MPYTQLTTKERFLIELLLLMGLGFREIGRELNRSHTTISREVQRNHRGDVYCSLTAEKKASSRRLLPRHYRRQTYSTNGWYVEGKLALDWSPEQIANVLRIDFPGDERMRISSETIYHWAYIDAQQGGQIYRHLRRHHRRRRIQKRYGAGRRFFKDRVSISERPDVANSRSRYGDWEADLVLGGMGQGALATCLERKSRYLVADIVPDKTADSFNFAIENSLADVQSELRQTLTLDNGKEMAGFKKLEKATGLTVYFADPYAAWQRGGNENVNGLLRQYFPKGCNFRHITKEQVRQAVHRLNHRPRKCLNYQTPHEVFSQIRGGTLAN